MNQSETGNSPDTKPKLSRRKRITFSLLTISFLLIPLMIVELGLRIHYAGRFPTKLQPHPVYGHAMRPNWQGFEGKPERNILVKTNELSLRQPNEIKAQKPAKPLVLFLGDSVTYGYRLANSETLSEQFEDHSKDHFTAINAGCVGYGPPHYLLRAKELLPKLKPTHVVVCLCYNDFGQLDPVVGQNPGLTQRLIDSSALIWSVTRKLRKLNREAITPQNLKNRFDVTPEAAAKAASRTLKIMQDLANTCTTHNAKLSIIIWPSQDQLQDFEKTHKYSPEQAQFQTLVNSGNPQLKSLNLADFLAKQPKPRYIDHCHPTSSATSTVAKLLAEELIRQEKQ